MIHFMKLSNAPFDKIKNGSKTIELRIYDEKRRKIKVGDKICFSSKENTIITTVKSLNIFRNFEELYETLPLDKCGYAENELENATFDDMLLYYSKKQIEKYGVIGIEIEVEK